MKALFSPAILILLLVPSLQAASYFKHITIDGSFEDWAGVPPANTDPQDASNATDIRNVYIAHDADYIYVRLTLYSPGDPFTAHNNIFIDADANGGTGFATHVGSEMLIQSGVGYQEKNGDFNEGGINGLDWAAAPTIPSTDFEVRISRSATYESDGMQVFAGANIALLLEAEDPNFNPVEFAPDSGGTPYELTLPPPEYPPTLEPANLVLLGGDWWGNDRVWISGRCGGNSPMIASLKTIGSPAPACSAMRRIPEFTLCHFERRSQRGDPHIIFAPPSNGTTILPALF